MTGHTREELLVAHEQLVDNEDDLIAGGSIGIGDSGTSSALRADRGKEPPVIAKVGGVKTADPRGVVSGVARPIANGTDVVVVYDDSTAVDETLEELGEELACVESPSGVPDCFTDKRAMEVFSMVIPGKLNTDLAALFREAGVDALDLSGADDNLLTGPRKSAVCVAEGGKKRTKRSDHSGKITPVDTTLLETLLDGGYTSIVTVPILADDGMPVNANADHAAAAVAGMLGMKFVILTDVKGVYAGPNDESTLIKMTSTPEEFSALGSTVEGFMTKKVMAAKEVLDDGATEVVVVDTNLSGPIVTMLNGSDTHVTPGALVKAEGAE